MHTTELVRLLDKLFLLGLGGDTGGRRVDLRLRTILNSHLDMTLQQGRAIRQYLTRLSCSTNRKRQEHQGYTHAIHSNRIGCKQEREDQDSYVAERL